MAIPIVRHSYPKEIILAFASVALSLLICESILRLAGTYLTHSEKTTGTYFSSRHAENLDSWLWRHPPLGSAEVNRGEFVFKRSFNSIGLSESEIRPKAHTEFRLLAIGDSFTEGVGTTYDSTWVKLLGAKLDQADTASLVTTVNAGIGGSDVVYGTMLYEQSLKDLDPDLVLLTINSSDISDICLRGGWSRFLENGTVRVQIPSWEVFYQGSHVWRLVTHIVLRYNWNLVPRKTVEQRKQEFTNICSKALRRLNSRCNENGAKLLVVVHPTLPDLNKPGYDDVEMNELIERTHHSNLQLIDLRTAFQNDHDPSRLFWPIDGHFNHLGNELMASALTKHIISDPAIFPRSNAISRMPPQTD